MPIITTLVMRRFSPVDGQSPSASRATITWPTISPGVRLRTSFCVPVWQKRQFSVQPTWLRNAQRAAPRLGNEDGFEFLPALAAQQPFARAVAGDLFGDDLRPLQRKVRRHVGAEILRQIGHRREVARAMDIDPVPQLAHAHVRGLLGTPAATAPSFKASGERPRREVEVIHGTQSVISR